MRLFLFQFSALVAGCITLLGQNGDGAKDGGAQGCSARTGWGCWGPRAVAHAVRFPRVRRLPGNVGRTRKIAQRRLYAWPVAPNLASAPGKTGGVFGAAAQLGLSVFSYCLVLMPVYEKVLLAQE